MISNTERTPADVILEDLEKKEAGGGEIQNVGSSVPQQHSVSMSVSFPRIRARLTPPTHSNLSSFSNAPLHVQGFALGSVIRSLQTVTSTKRSTAVPFILASGEGGQEHD